ncbi:MAG: hypothetical protein ACI4TJ_03715 [Candidatus Cryptobacteroides sp.]
MKRAVLLLLLPVLCSVECMAQSRPQLVYDLGFEYCFDNREFDSGQESFTDSRTIHAARLTPAIGLSLPSSADVQQRIMLGIDIFKNMGDSPTSEELRNSVNSGLLREMTLWYAIEASLPKTTVKGYAGIFPRRYSVFGNPDTPKEDMPGRDIPSLFLSDANRFYDSNLEGILVTSANSRSYYELSLDWLGLFGSRRREQFIIQSYGKGSLSKWIHAGWVASLHHYANSLEYSGVIDNATLAPFLYFGFERLCRTPFDRLSLTFHYIQGIHQDRRNSTGLEYAFGGQVSLDVRKRNFGIRNEIYYGMGQMPYYDLEGPDGNAYSSSLYRGNPFYRISPNGDWKVPGVYDRLDLYYQPIVAGILNLRISNRFHFSGNGYEGWQQVVLLSVNLDRFRVKN